MESDPTNSDRAMRIREILDNHEVYRDADYISPVVDMLADIQHFCREEGIDFSGVLATARMHFEAEIEESEGLQSNGGG